MGCEGTRDLFLDGVDGVDRGDSLKQKVLRGPHSAREQFLEPPCPNPSRATRSYTFTPPSTNYAI